MNKDNRKRRKFQHLGLEEREEIAILLEKEMSLSEIALKLGFHKSTISREIRRNSPPKRHVKYRGHRAQMRSDARKYESRQKVRLKTPEIREYVISKISEGWSPEQASGRIAIDNEDWSINHESIYLFIYSERTDLTQHLRQRRQRRLKKGQAKNKRCIRVPGRTMIGERPAVINERIEYGHWEADTMISRKSKPCVMGVLERKSGYTILEKLSGKTATEMHRGLVERLGCLPGKLVKSITYDNGTENVLHRETNEVLKTDSFFCNPYHSWEKGSVENMFGLLRQYLLKGSDLDKISEYGLRAIENRLNNRPRKRLGYKTPAEVFCNLVA